MEYPGRPTPGLYVGCDGTSIKKHDMNTNIEHIANHLAHYIYYEHTAQGRAVDILTHSMGGLISRYAIQHSVGSLQQNPNGFWPGALDVEDVVTLSTPHLGVRFYHDSSKYVC